MCKKRHSYISLAQAGRGAEAIATKSLSPVRLSRDTPDAASFWSGLNFCERTSQNATLISRNKPKYWDKLKYWTPQAFRGKFADVLGDSPLGHEADHFR